MSWPVNPTNGQQAYVNGITYEWNATDSVWNRKFASVIVPDLTTIPTVSFPAQPNITSTGTLSSLTVTGDSVITGNLTVTGTTEYLNTISLKIQDPLIELGGGANGAPLTTNDNRDRGLVLHYYSAAGAKPVDAFMGWDNSAGEFKFASNANITGEVATFNTYGNVRGSYFFGDGSQLTGTIGSANYSAFAANITSGEQPNITSTGTLTSLSVTGLVTATAGGIKVGNLQDTTGTNTIQLTNSDIIVTGDITAGGGGIGNVTATYMTGTLSAASASQPNITTVGNLANLTVNSWFSQGQTTETISNLGAVSGPTVTCNLATSGTFYHSSVTSGANWTINFTNVPTTTERTIVSTVFVAQGATAYTPTAVQIDGASQTVKWSAGQTPVGTVNGVDIFTFALIRLSGGWVQVLGTSSGFL